MAKRMPRYEVRNDGSGPYAIFYCDECGREFRSLPDIKRTIAQDIGRQTMGGFLRNIPLVGSAAANAVTDDPRHSYEMTPQQLEAAWEKMQDRFGECPTCNKVVCLSCFDTQSGYCNDCTPRRAEIAEAQAEQAGGVVRGLASAFGLGDLVRNAAQAAQNASAQMARCPKDGTLAQPGTKFCPECGSPMVQPAAGACPKCGAETHGAKFCPQCGAKLEQAAAKCKNCGAELKGAKFCPECGTKAG
ncbi:MAG TPA: zinc ribbon domain-containing protein [Anaerolineae bacterium]|nr:zinc ribbon domain-containing protein [Anaerolineae bacterium]HOQ98242.1 zinc ribbon domain-containing protein [Anaerolineae bacterium]HPL27434.1 zinc ribbon domain-containing protein [Anaerolineae bacterium]